MFPMERLGAPFYQGVMKTTPNPGLAAAFMVLASALLAGTTLLAKALGTDTLGQPLHPMQVSQARFMFAFAVVAMATAILRPTFKRPAWSLHVARTLCGWTGVTLMFAASARIPLADATAISFTNPVFTMLLAILLLGERVGPWRWAAAAVALVGGLILLRPGGDSLQLGALFALAAAAITGMEIIFIKQLSDRERPIPLMLVNNGIGLILSSIALAFVFQSPTAMQWAALALLGVTMAAAQFCFINAMSRADASYVVPFSYATLVFAAVYDLALFGVLPDAISVVGAGIILLGAAVLAWREALSKRPQG